VRLDSRPVERRDEARSDHPPFLLTALVLGAISASRFLAVAAEPGEIDEAIFSGAVLHYDLFDLSPQAPGFPVWILLGRLMLRVVPSPFTALAVTSTLLAALAFPALYLWGRRLVGGWAALSGALFAAVLPVVWVNGGRAFSDTPGTALVLIGLALLGEAEERSGGSPKTWRRRSPRRREAPPSETPALFLASAAGLAAAAGLGVRPHLLMMFAAAFLFPSARLLLDRGRRSVGIAFLAAGAGGCLLWLAWLTFQAGGVAGLLASLGERVEFRSNAMATVVFGGLRDTFLVRDFVWERAALATGALAALGLGALALRRLGQGALLALVLLSGFLSLFFLHNREMSRYSVPFVLVLALAVGAGAQALCRSGVLGLALCGAFASLYVRDTYAEARWGATHETPPAAALRHLSRTMHAGRETIVLDSVFPAFMRLEVWEGRLWGWGYLESELVIPKERDMNKRLVRLYDFTPELDSGVWQRRGDRLRQVSGDREPDGGWVLWQHRGLIAESLGNRRLLAVGVRDPAPPVFGPGFGMRERLPGQPSFRWAGRDARLTVPGLVGPPAALLSGTRAGTPTTLTVKEGRTGRVVSTRRVLPGAFQLALVGGLVHGPLPAPQEWILSCDDPQTLPIFFPGGVRPQEGCFTFLEGARELPPEELWERSAGRYLVDVGNERDGRADLAGFHAREEIRALSMDFRWTTGEASLVWVPLPGVAPHRLALRARTPGAEPVAVAVTIGGQAAGSIVVPPGEIAEAGLELPPDAREAMAGASAVRIELRCPATSLAKTGRGTDVRELGVAVDRVLVE